MLTIFNARAVGTASALAIVAVSITGCARFIGYRASQGPKITPSCELGYVRQDVNGHSTFTRDGHTAADSYLITFSNNSGGRTGQVSDVGIWFYGASGAKIGSQTPALRPISVGPRRSVSVVVYGPNSDLAVSAGPAAHNWVRDADMPSGAARCHVYTWTVGSTSGVP